MSGRREEGIPSLRVALTHNIRLMLRHSFDAGALFLPVLWQGDRPICALASLVDARKRSFLFFITGRDQTFDGPLSGLVLHAHSIRHAIRNGFVTYDFLRGNETYKYSFGVEERRIESFVLSRKDRKNLGSILDRRCLRFVLRKSMEHHRAGRRAEAECGYRQLLEVEPHNADALYGLGQITQGRGEHAAAVKLFRTLLTAVPDTPKAWFRLGRSLKALSELSAAASAYCDGIERQPAIAGAYYDLGHILLQLGQADLAVVTFEAAQDLQRDFPDLEASLARARRSRVAMSSEELARRAADHADLRGRVGKLPAIAAATDRRPSDPISTPGKRDLQPSSPSPLP